MIFVFVLFFVFFFCIFVIGGSGYIVGVLIC